MQVHQIQRTATAAWCNVKGRPLLATGTLVGTMTENFDPTGTLELFSIDYKKKVVEEPVARIVTDEKFYKLAWSGQCSVNGSQEELGFLAGGMGSGVIGLWSASSILSGSSSPFASKHKHVGAVRGLDFNPFQSSLLASGGYGGEVFVWDLSTMSPVPPAVDSKGPAGDSECTCVAWNKQAKHILGTSAHNGITVIWDLRTKRPALHFSDPSSPGSRCSSLVWNPDSPVHLITTIDDELHPVVLSWDLRNYLSPSSIFRGHSAGVLSSSWCPQDHELVATSGKDGQSIVWDVTKGAQISEVTSSSWNFDVQWSPTLACILSTCSVGGQISLDSFHDFGTSGGKSSATTARSWLKRPVAVSFAFGGQLVSVPAQTNGKAAPVSIRTITIKDHELSDRAQKLYAAVNDKSFVEFCDFKISEFSEGKNINTDLDKGGAKVWEYLKLLFQEDPRGALLQNLGFHPDQLSKEVATFLEGTKTNDNKEIEAVEPASATPLEEPKTEEEQSSATEEVVEEKKTPADGATVPPGQLDSFFEGGDDPFDFASITAAKPPPAASTPSRLPEQQQQQQQQEESIPKIDFRPTDPVEKLITKCILVGNFEHAVDSCFGCGRISDALVLAFIGGPELLKKTQRRYMANQKSSYMQLISLIVKKEFAELVKQSHLDDWREVLAILCAWTETEFSSLCEMLGDRLYIEKQDVSSALLAYVCAGNLDKAASLWMKEEISSNNSLQTFMERVVIFSHAINRSSPGSALSSYYTQYAERLAGQGEIDIALAFLEPMKNEKDTPASILYNRINPSTPPPTKNTPTSSKTSSPASSLPPSRHLGVVTSPALASGGFSPGGASASSASSAAPPSSPARVMTFPPVAGGASSSPTAASRVLTFPPATAASSSAVRTFTPGQAAPGGASSASSAVGPAATPGPAGFAPGRGLFTPGQQGGASGGSPAVFTPGQGGASGGSPAVFTPGQGASGGSPALFTPGQGGASGSPALFTPGGAGASGGFAPSTVRAVAPNEGRDPSRSNAGVYTPPPPRTGGGPVTGPLPTTTTSPTASRFVAATTTVAPPSHTGYAPPPRGGGAGGSSTIIPPPSFVSGAGGGGPARTAVVTPATTVAASSAHHSSVVAPPPRAGYTPAHVQTHPSHVAPAQVTAPPPPKKEEPVAPPPAGAGKRRVAPVEQEEEKVDGTETAQRLMSFASQVAAYEEASAEMVDITPRLSEFAEKAANKAFPSTILLLIDELLIALSQRDFALADKLYSSLSQNHYALVGQPAMIGLKKFKALVSAF